MNAVQGRQVHPMGNLAPDDPTRPDVVHLWGSATGVGDGTPSVSRNTQPSSVLSLAGDTEQRISWAPFALRWPPRQRSWPQARLLIVREPKV